MCRFRAASIRAALLLAVPGIVASAHAETFRWVDERGVVTYSNTPPVSGMQSTSVVPVTERVSVYTPDAQLKAAMQSAAGRDAKIDRLERELESARQTRQAQRNSAYDRCVNERRTDCETISVPVPAIIDPYAITGFAPLYYAPRYVGIAARGNAERARPFMVVDNPVRVGVDNRPKVGIDERPKVGIDERPKVGVDNRSPAGIDSREPTTPAVKRAPQHSRTSNAVR